MAYTSKRPGSSEVVVLEVHPEGCYVLVFSEDNMNVPVSDYLQDNVETAMKICEAEFNIALDSWQVAEGWRDIM